jgi:hypothetical protein
VHVRVERHGKHIINDEYIKYIGWNHRLWGNGPVGDNGGR